MATKTKKDYVIARCNERGTLFMFESTDYRVGVSAAVITTGMANRKDYETANNGYRAFLFIGTNGQRYRVFPDYSVREV